MDPRVDSHTVISTVCDMPDVTYYIKHTKTSEIRKHYPVLIFGARYRNGTRYEIIPETFTPSSVWEELRKASSTPDAYYRHTGLKNNPIQIIACDKEVLFISDGEDGICPRGRMQIFIPPAPASSWFRIARDVVGVYEIECKKDEK